MARYVGRRGEIVASLEAALPHRDPPRLRRDFAETSPRPRRGGWEGGLCLPVDAARDPAAAARPLRVHGAERPPASHPRAHARRRRDAVRRDLKGATLPRGGVPLLPLSPHPGSSLHTSSGCEQAEFHSCRAPLGSVRLVEARATRRALSRFQPIFLLLGAARRGARARATAQRGDASETPARRLRRGPRRLSTCTTT